MLCSALPDTAAIGRVSQRPSRTSAPFPMAFDPRELAQAMDGGSADRRRIRIRRWPLSTSDDARITPCERGRLRR